MFDAFNAFLVRLGGINAEIARLADEAAHFAGLRDALSSLADDYDRQADLERQMARRLLTLLNGGQPVETVELLHYIRP